MIQRFWKREGDAVFWAVEALSGVSLLLNALLSLVAGGLEAVPHSVVAASGIIGVFQILSAATRDALCATLVAYPAGVLCLTVAALHTIMCDAIDPVSAFAVTWGLLNYCVVRHNWGKVKASTGG